MRSGASKLLMIIMHEQDATRDPLEKQLTNLEQLFEEFAEQYETAARDLREGRVPNRVPGIQLDAARKVLTDTLLTLSEAARPFDIDPLHEEASLSEALAYLKNVQEARAEAERQRLLLEEARMVVAEMELLEHQAAPDALHRVHEAIAELSSQLEARNLEEAEHLTSGQHPLSKLVAYTGHRDTLSDEEYDAFRESIEQHFGRPLLRDIDRGWVIKMTSSSSEDTRADQGETDDDVQLEIIEESQESEAPVLALNDTELDETEPYEFNDEAFEKALENDFDPSHELTLAQASSDLVEDDATSNYEITEYASLDEALEDEPTLDQEPGASFNDVEKPLEEEDTLWPPIEGDGFGALEEDNLPEASVHESNEEEDND